MVVKVDDYELHGASASSGRDPRWAIARKFAPTGGHELHGIEWNVGRFGELTRWRVLEPVQVGGVTVRPRRCTTRRIARKDIRVGDEVIVLRAGEVIPR